MFMAKKKKRLQAMSVHQMKKIIDGNTTPHGPAALGKTHQGGNSKGTCTQRSISPLATGHRSIDHQSTSLWPFAQWTRRHFRTTSHRSNGHYTRIFKSVNHRSTAIQPPVIGLRKYQHREVSIHRSPVS